MSPPLLALSPLDGRYATKVESLRPIFSEFGLMQRRVLVEVRWLIALSDEPGIVEVAPFTAEARTALEAIAASFGESEGERIKAIGTKARERLQELLERPVHLELFVRVTERWKDVPRQLSELGYDIANAVELAPKPRAKS